MAQTQNSIDIPLSIGLLNRLRNFEHKAHTFDQIFLEEVDAILNQLQKRVKTAAESGSYTFESLIIIVHYYFSLIYNLDTFVSQFQGSHELVSLNFSAINSTNIFNVHSLLKALSAKRSNNSSLDISYQTDATESTQEERGTPLEVHFLQRFRIQVSTNETKATSSHLMISIELVKMHLVFNP